MPPGSDWGLNPATLAWPDEAEAASDSLEANHYYMADIRLVSWEDVESILKREREALALLEAAQDAEAEWENFRERITTQADNVADEFLASLDPGVASATLALAAAGCIPFWSCNGGAFGGHHSSNEPVVRFFARPEHTALITACAKLANVNLLQDEHGRCAITTSNIRAMHGFALAMRHNTHD